MTTPDHAIGEGRGRPATALDRVAYVAFAAYLILMLGGNGVAQAGGPPTWLPLWQLPAADGEWVGIGLISLLPPLSVAAWLLARHRAGRLRALTPGLNRVTLPLAGLALLGALSLLAPCFGGDCNTTAILRLALLLVHLAWVYLYVLNERPPLFWLVVAIIALQSTVALGQFVAQRDLGLRFLGEISLDPQERGVGVVMRGATRWLRAYGLTPHPNVLAGTLVPMLLLLPVLGAQPTRLRRLAATAALVLGFAALFTTLARWAAFCLALGLAINASPWLLGTLRGRRPTAAPFERPALVGLALVAVVMLAIYGDAVVGRAVSLDTPIESRSLWERDRDLQLAWRLLGENPLTGVGLGRYLPEAQVYDAWAQRVHNIPLALGAELGLGGMLLWLVLVVAPLWRREALTRFAPETALWLSFWLLGLFYERPNPLYELRNALLTGVIAAVVALSLRGLPAYRGLRDAAAHDILE